MCGNFSQVSIKERRKFTDIMDEEINEERNSLGPRRPRRLAREVGTPMYMHGEWKTLKKETGITKPEPIDDSDFIMPFFREKLKDVSYQSGDRVVLSCFAVGVPAPTYTWFRNESILIETNRTKVKRTEDGRCQLILDPSKEYDIGVYKCVARNSQGSVVCRARLFLGDVPSNIVPPTIKDYSSNSALLMWNSPKHAGDAFIQCYKLEYKKIDDTEWLVSNGNIRQEFYLVDGLESNQSYHFRISASNKFGWNAPSEPSDTIKTLESQESKTIALDSALKFVCNDDLEPTTAIITTTSTPDINYTQENASIPLIKSEYKELYDFKEIIASGKFSVIARAYVKDGSKKNVACKCILTQSEKESSTNNEYEICKTLAHENIARLLYANRDDNLFTLATELCSGLNILTYLCRRPFYTEQCVANVICQVLNAIEYLHFRSIGLLELQPDNVLIVSETSLQIKLTDFSNARPIPNKSGTKVTISANPEYIGKFIIEFFKIVFLIMFFCC